MERSEAHAEYPLAAASGGSCLAGLASLRLIETMHTSGDRFHHRGGLRRRLDWRRCARRCWMRERQPPRESPVGDTEQKPGRRSCMCVGSFRSGTAASPCHSSDGAPWLRHGRRGALERGRLHVPVIRAGSPELHVGKACECVRLEQPDFRRAEGDSFADMPMHLCSLVGAMEGEAVDASASNIGTEREQMTLATNHQLRRNRDAGAWRWRRHRIRPRAHERKRHRHIDRVIGPNDHSDRPTLRAVSRPPPVTGAEDAARESEKHEADQHRQAGRSRDHRLKLARRRQRSSKFQPNPRQLTDRRDPARDTTRLRARTLATSACIVRDSCSAPSSRSGGRVARFARG